MQEEKYLIIGNGILGASTAEALLRRKHQVQVVDCGYPGAASADTHKIVRVDYPGAGRLHQVQALQQEWQRNKLCYPYYYTTGRLVIFHRSAQARLDAINSARKECNLPIRHSLTLHNLDEYVDRPDARKFLREILERLTPSKLQDYIFTFNPDDGVVNWAAYMKNLHKVNAQRGCQTTRARVVKLHVQEDQVAEIWLEEGDPINTQGAHVIVAAGAWTTELQVASGLLKAGESEKLTATGVFAFYPDPAKHDASMLAGLPAISLYGMPTGPDGRGPDGGEIIFPVDGSGSEMKVGITWPFMGDKVGDCVQYSQPRDRSETSVGKQAFEYASAMVSWLAPKIDLSGAKKDQKWDAVTTSQSLYVENHPLVKNLTLASGGSYNHAKDGPNLGTRIIDVMSGNSSRQSVESTGSSQHRHLATTNRFSDLERGCNYKWQF